MFQRPGWGGLPRMAVLYALSTLMLAGAGAHRAAAQKGPAPAASLTSGTMAGVYTRAQADRGEETYMNLCVGCHTATVYSGYAFAVTWDGRPLSDLYGQIKYNMPKNEPDTLTPAEAAQLVAYILKINRVPAGKAELKPDEKALEKIKIEMPIMRQGKDQQTAAR
jgi:mono/diheme cytochrome c family protein